MVTHSSILAWKIPDRGTWRGSVSHGVTESWKWLSIRTWAPLQSERYIFPGKNTGVGVISSPRGSSQPRDQTCISCISRRILYPWATSEVPQFYWVAQKVRSVFSIQCFEIPVTCLLLPSNSTPLPGKVSNTFHLITNFWPLPQLWNPEGLQLLSLAQGINCPIIQMA